MHYLLIALARPTRPYFTLCPALAALLFVLLLLLPWDSMLAQARTLPFTIQIASCDTLQEAESIAGKLSQQGVKVEIFPAELAGRKIVYRLRVGQFPSLAAARAEADRLLASKVISSSWITRITERPVALQTAAATAPDDPTATRKRTVTEPRALPELSLGELVGALSDRWSVRLPESIGVYSASIINRKTGAIRAAIVMMDEARMQRLAPPLIKRQELLNPIELRFSPGVKNSPAHHGMNFATSEKLTKSLRTISGYQDLDFDERGYLVLGERISGGSDLARMLLRTAVESNEVFEIESIEGSDAIAFGAFLSAQFDNNERGAVAFNRIQLDFQDFSELRGNAALLEAFDPGFVFLHELAHGVWELPDEGKAGLGECEAYINQIRRQLGLPERVRYHYQVRGLPAGGEQGEMIFVSQGEDGRRQGLRLYWNNRAVNSNQPNSTKGSATKPK
ncbi:MAG TPA: SPOR domain-containing protein [Blastocatellia bacterium]|nr:SPOR domain-containing protein [Blastocatellia bacterium]